MNILQRTRRHNRIRAKVTGTADRPRASVFRSNRQMVVQLIDDVAGKTLVAVHEVLKVKEGGKVGQATVIGKKVAVDAKAKGIEKIVFDRGGYQYQGRVKAVADAMRENGLVF
jgi:large subunit ribosomal protein L18